MEQTLLLAAFYQLLSLAAAWAADSLERNLEV